MDAKPFAHELALLPELPQRERKVAERLAELPVEVAVELLHDLVRLADAADGDARVALVACVGLNRYEKLLGYERLADLYVEADERGYKEVKRLLTTSEVRKKGKRGGPRRDAENDYIEKTLGERKALTRTTDRDLLDRLLFDRNPEVIRLLLSNKRIIERDVIKIAAMRPSTPQVLNELIRSPRWSSSYPVKKALALNPYLPTNDAISLLVLLTRQDLKAVAASIEVSDTVRDAANEALLRRAGRPEDDDELH